MANLVRSETRDVYPFSLIDALLRWDPRRSEPGPAFHGGAGFAPAFDVKEIKDAYVIRADLPGVKDQDLAISMTGNQLTVAGRRKEEDEGQEGQEGQEGKEGARYYTLERSRGSFARTFVLPDGVDGEHVTAALKDGVLSLHIPKRPEAQPRKIQIGKGASGAGAEA